MPPSSLAPHERRERWMTAIAGSFHQATIWRATRDQRLEIEELVVALSHRIPTFLAKIEDLLQAHRTRVFCHQVTEALDVVRKGYRAVMKWLEQGSWTIAEEQEKKELHIKHLIIFNHYRKVFGECFSRFRKLARYFKEVLKAEPRKRVRRRRSCSDLEDTRSAGTEQRLVYEVMLRDVAKVLEKSLVDGLSKTHEQYNSSQLFCEYVANVQDRNEKEEKLWKREGKRYPYPDYKLKDPTQKKVSFWFCSSKVQEVPPWSEDEELQKWFP
ncbi:hypothetical protein LTR64_003219 [Lithohypha guttulata]|uniref:uncharacterized protein n=1 Tax=Lithohypha guttulata TaxID=1690604 RepID=UPI002DE1BD7F|nr:hypothetical protein LTR51_000559 [Lithohypha guttulata]